MKNSQRVSIILIIFLFLIYFPVFAFAQKNKPIGVNLAAVTDYSTELVFTDAFKQSRKWISSNHSGLGEWDTQIDIPLNKNGYPKQIPYSDGFNPPQLIKTLILWDLGAAVPKGNYRLKVQGNGQVRLKFGATGTYNCPIDTLVSVTGQVMLEITKSDPVKPISEINFIYPEYVNKFPLPTFTKEFLNFLQDFQVLRFMDFTQTNNSKVVSWEDRTLKTDYSQAKSTGVAWEYVVELANTTKKDIWINIPHQADDRYLKNLAVLLKNSLNSKIKIYLEYSNELWNPAFSQSEECSELAKSIGFKGESWERSWKYTAKRSADLFQIFSIVFQNDQRLIKIIPSQAANSWLSEQLISFFYNPLYNPQKIKADALAIAPYFGNEIADQIVENGLVKSITVQQIIKKLEKSLFESYQWIESNKKIAKENNLQLISYEGGQHLVATGKNSENQILTKKLIEVNKSPEMQNLYCRYFNYWYSKVGNLFCHFSSHGNYSQWGSWGLKENFQDLNNPKYRALQNCVF